MRKSDALFIAFLLCLGGCAAGGSSTATMPIGSNGTPATLQRGPNLFVASEGTGKPGTRTGHVTVYGLKRGKLLQTITRAIDAPVALTFSSGYLFVANSQPFDRSNQYSGSVSAYLPANNTPAFLLRETADPDALAFDSSGNVYVANRYGVTGNNSCGYGTIGVYGSGQQYPMRVIGAAYDSVVLPAALALDDAENLYVANDGYVDISCRLASSITVFAPGTTAPLATITKGIRYPRAIAIAPGVLYVANYPPHLNSRKLPHGDVTVYDLRTNRLLRTITDGINAPMSLALDTAGNLYVANSVGRDVSVYAPGVASPVRVITKGATSPRGLLFGAKGDLYVANVKDDTVSAYYPGESTPRMTIHVPYPNPVALALSPGP